MIQQELFTKIKLIGVESGIVEIDYVETTISISFYDEDTGVNASLYSVELGEFSFIKESHVIGNFDLSRIKNSEDAEGAEKLLLEKGNKMKAELIAKAKELATEIKERAGIPVEVIPRLKGSPSVTTEFDDNMWHASEVLGGFDWD